MRQTELRLNIVQVVGVMSLLVSLLFSGVVDQVFAHDGDLQRW